VPQIRVDAGAFGVLGERAQQIRAHAYQQPRPAGCGVEPPEQLLAS